VIFYNKPDFKPDIESRFTIYLENSTTGIVVKIKILMIKNTFLKKKKGSRYPYKKVNHKIRK